MISFFLILLMDHKILSKTVVVMALNKKNTTKSTFTMSTALFTGLSPLSSTASKTFARWAARWLPMSTPSIAPAGPWRAQVWLRKNLGFLGSPYERDCYLGVPVESQTTNPNHQLTIIWHVFKVKTLPCLGIGCFCFILRVLTLPQTEGMLSPLKNVGEDDLDHPCSPCTTKIPCQIHAV